MAQEKQKDTQLDDKIRDLQEDMDMVKEKLWPHRPWADKSSCRVVVVLMGLVLFWVLSVVTFSFPGFVGVCMLFFCGVMAVLTTIGLLLCCFENEFPWD